MRLFINASGLWVQTRYFAIRLSWDDLAELAELTPLSAETLESQPFPAVFLNSGDVDAVLFSLNQMIALCFGQAGVELVQLHPLIRSGYTEKTLEGYA